ncbi:MAG: exodeoxyribonuclease VII small subunit [Oscillospiraceae bacterium]|nr:exodeoxyribonuclease VII small subunit [Oscillospiraceae bacterium]
MDESNLTFEAAMQRLDAIVRMLEQGNAPLDASLSLFEEGAALLKLCNGMLDAAEQKVTLLQKGPDGAPVGTPFVSEDTAE